MPKAPVDEHRNLPSREDHVRTHSVAAREINSEVAAVPIPGGVKSGSQGELRPRVSAPVRLHVVAPRVRSLGLLSRHTQFTQLIFDLADPAKAKCRV
jgi:hypothetical protein